MNHQPTCLLKIAEVSALTRMSRSWIYARLKEKGSAFPRPIRVSSRCVAWLARDVEQWLADRPRAGVAEG
jgi:predicted DNA-binding transcriptional regulator AlpA